MKRRSLAVLLLLAAAIVLPRLSFGAPLGLSRISLMEGDVQIRTEEAGEWIPAAINTPLKEGDSVWAPEGARVELQFRDGTIVRLRGGSSLDILELDDDLMQFNLSRGSAYVRTGRMKDNTLQIDLPDTSVSLDDPARFRIDLASDGDEEVSIYRGSAYVESRGSRTSVRGGEMLSIDEGSTEISPLNAPDEWERWNTKRDRVLDRRESARYLPPELATYSSDFDGNGEWVTTADYGYVWRPTVISGPDWSPYRVGRWMWVGGDYVWVSYEPWGWAPYHYGRWVSLSFGWCWVPPVRTEVYWSPGYVGWVSTPTYVGWVPLAPGEIYYGRGYYGPRSVNIVNVQQTTVINNITYKNVTVNNGVTVVNRQSFGTANVVYARPKENIFRGGASTTFVARPDVKPTHLAVMPVVKNIPAAKLPPPAVRRVDVKELREKRPVILQNVDGKPRLRERLEQEKAKRPDVFQKRFRVPAAAVSTAPADGRNSGRQQRPEGVRGQNAPVGPRGLREPKEIRQPKEESNAQGLREQKDARQPRDVPEQRDLREPRQRADRGEGARQGDADPDAQVAEKGNRGDGGRQPKVWKVKPKEKHREEKKKKEDR